jgi:hypothetical protein
MKLVNIGALILSVGLSQATFAATDIRIGVGHGGITIGRDHGRHDRDHGDRWGRHRRATTCFARNGRGITFQATGMAPEFVIQRQAVRECRYSRATRNPNTCRPLGCQTRRW